MNANRLLVVGAVALLAAVAVAPGPAVAAPDAAGAATPANADSAPAARSAATGLERNSSADATPTYVEENVSEDATWTPEDGPYYVGRDVTIAPGATLTVEPGTTVNVGEEVTIRVEGSLVAAGSAEAPVAFTSAEPSPSAGTWETIEYAGGSESTLRLEHAVVEYGTTAITATSGEGAIRVRQSTVRNHVRTGLAVRERGGAPSVTVAGSRFANLGRAGVAFDTLETDPYLDRVQGVTVRNSEFTGTGTSGVLVRARRIADVTVRGVTVAGTAGAGVAFETESTDARPQSPSRHYAADVTVRDATVVGTGGDGVRFQGGALRSVDVRGNDVRDASGAGIRVADGTAVDDAQFAANTVVESRTGLRLSLQRATGGIQHVSLSITGNEFSRNTGVGIDVDAEYVIVDRFDVRNNTVSANGGTGVSLSTQQLSSTVLADNVVRGNDGDGVDVWAVRVRGLRVAENRLVGNGGDGLSVRAADVLAGLDVGRNDVLDNDAFGVDLAHDRGNGATNVVHNSTIAANADGVRVDGPAPTRLVDNAVVLNTAARERWSDAVRSNEATGVVVSSSSANVELARNDVYGHITGLRSAADGTVVAEHNYWGAESGPYHATLNPDGRGNAVVTDRGKADPVPFATEPFGQRYERPTAVLVANATTVAPGDAVAFSARQSTDDGRLAAYYFTVDGDRLATTQAPTHVAGFEEPGTYQVALAVEDAMGVRSLNDATVTVRVTDQPAATEPTPATTPEPNTTTPGTTTAPVNGGDASLLGSLVSLWGGLGGLFYAVAVALGAHGMALTLRGRDPPVSGVTIHALAALGVLTWAVAGVLGGGTLVALAGVGAVAWGAATGVAFAVAAR